MKIFILEDDVNYLSGLTAKFRIEGFDVSSDPGTDDLIQSVSRILSFQPNLLILDLILPKFNGFDILIKLRGHDQGCQIPTLIFSRQADSETKAKSERLGANFFVSKTDISLDDFVLKTKKIIKNNLLK